MEKACKRRDPTNLLVRIFLDPKVKNGVIWELENGKKAINWSLNVKIRHGWSHLELGGARS